MKRLIGAAILLLIASVSCWRAWPEEIEFNPIAGHYEVTFESYDLRYNPMDDGWEYARPSDVLRHNPIEDTWEYGSPSDRLKYNVMEERWEYVPPDMEPVRIPSRIPAYHEPPLYYE